MRRNRGELPNGPSLLTSLLISAQTSLRRPMIATLLAVKLLYVLDTYLCGAPLKLESSLSDWCSQYTAANLMTRSVFSYVWSFDSLLTLLWHVIIDHSDSPLLLYADRWVPVPGFIIGCSTVVVILFTFVFHQPVCQPRDPWSLDCLFYYLCSRVSCCQYFMNESMFDDLLLLMTTPISVVCGSYLPKWLKQQNPLENPTLFGVPIYQTVRCT